MRDSGNGLALNEKSASTLTDLCDLISQKERIGRFLLQEALDDLSLLSEGENAPPTVTPKPASTVPSMFPVRLLTMHRAKGNEFDDVYLSGWEEGVFPASGKSVAEERRLAYVALTRSRQRVMITYASRRRTMDSGGKVVGMNPSRFLSELRERNEAVKTESGYFLPGMATQVGAGWIERWPQPKRRMESNGDVRVEPKDNADNAKEKTKEVVGKKRKAKKVNSEEPPHVEEVVGGADETKEFVLLGGVDTFKYKTKRAEKEAAALTHLLGSLAKGSLKATPAKAMFKAKLANLGITRGSGEVTDKKGKLVTKTLSKMTAAQLGEYLLQQIR